MKIHNRDPRRHERFRRARSFATQLNKRGVRARRILYETGDHLYFSDCVQVTIPSREDGFVVRVLKWGVMVIPHHDFFPSETEIEDVAPFIVTFDGFLALLHDLSAGRPIFNDETDVP